MNETLRFCFGALLSVAGALSVVSSLRRRALLLVLYGLASVALGVGLLLRFYGLETAFGAIPVLVGTKLMVEGVRKRSTKTTLAAIAVAAAGAGVLAGLLTANEVVLALVLVFGGWGLFQAVRARAAGGMLFYGGMAAILLSTTLVPSDAPFGVEFVISMAGFLAFIVGILLDGWRFPMLGGQQSPTESDSTLTTEH